MAARLKALGIVREIDLLFHLPLRYEDRTRITPLGRIRPEQSHQVEGTVADQQIRPGRRRSMLVLLEEPRGQLTLRFFRFYPNQKRMLAPGRRVRCYGEVRHGPEGLEMVHPQVTPLEGNRPPPLPENLTAIYPCTTGLAQANLARLIDQALDRLARKPELLADPLGPDETGMGLAQAILTAHRPPPDADLDALADGRHPAIRRLAFEELLGHNLAMVRLTRERARHQARDLKDPEGLAARLLANLPFTPTGAQKRVIGELQAELSGTRPMRRLLQGDVGSGKTVVAAWALALAAGSGRQAAIVAPTEILAEQHHKTLAEWLEPLGIEIVWLAGKVKGRARKHALEALKGQAGVAIGTHALFQAGVEFRDLALVVVDEQHRFGVHQRLELARKGTKDFHIPHQLIMTATPIPRTLAMTAYAGLDVSVLDELPPGRKPVTTVAINAERREEIIARIRSALEAGRQAYWVCTLIEETEEMEAEAAEATVETLRAALPAARVGLIHGRMKAGEKESVMAGFAASEVDLLVATTVIEVGVDVPNASLMIIENAERLGLSQLHQLRGRVGRGSRQSACVLIYRPPLSATARARLEVMRETGDGFVIAERDLELRGPGEVLGTRQTGMMRFRIADLARDHALLESASAAGSGILDQTPETAELLIRRWIGQGRDYGEV